MTLKEARNSKNTLIEINAPNGTSLYSRKYLIEIMDAYEAEITRISAILADEILETSYLDQAQEDPIEVPLEDLDEEEQFEDTLERTTLAQINRDKYRSLGS